MKVEKNKSSRYIDAELLKDRIRYRDYVTGVDRKPTPNEMKIEAPITFETLREWVDRCPTADVAPVVHARWVPKENIDAVRCSNCSRMFLGGAHAMEAFIYCPACGAKMDNKMDKGSEDNDH